MLLTTGIRVRMAIAVCALAACSWAQLRVHPRQDSGDAALTLALRRIGNPATVMICTAHPDDENSALIARLALGEGSRVVVVTATRGDGGQNEIGPEIFDALAVLRTEELAAVHRLDGAEQWFTRAVDFGYSFSVEETLSRWGRDEILGDFVRQMRIHRPDVVLTMHPIGDGGGQHHQTSAKLAAEAARLAGSSEAFPEQLGEGLRPWHVGRVLASTNFGLGAESQPTDSRSAESRRGRGRAARTTDSRADGPGESRPQSRPETWPTKATRVFTVETSVFDPVLGATFAEIGLEARSMHKCQGMAQLLALPSRSSSRFREVWSDGWATAEPTEPRHPRVSILDGIRMGVVGAISPRIPEGSPDRIPDDADIENLADAVAIDDLQDEIRRQFQSGERGRAGTGLLQLKDRLAGLRARLHDRVPPREWTPDAERLVARAEDAAVDAILASRGWRLDVLADDGVVIPGQEVKVGIHAVQHGADPIRLDFIRLVGFSTEKTLPESRPSAELKPGIPWTCTIVGGIPADARFTAPHWRRRADVDRYEFEFDAPFGAAFRPTPFLAQLGIEVGGRRIEIVRPIEFRHPGNIFSGEKRHEILVVPAYSVRVTPEIAAVPAMTSAPVSRSVRVTVTNCRPGPARGAVSLDLPPGWSSDPVQVPLTLQREDESMAVTFDVRVPEGTAPGRAVVQAVFRPAPTDASETPATFTRGFQIVEYPHTTRRHVFHDAAVTFALLDAKFEEGLRVGYVMGVGDDVPTALEQIGARVTLIGEEELAGGDLSRFDVIMTGVRAYERRPDLRSFNQRLLDYASAGGVVLVQYNKTEFNDAQYGPYPAKVTTNRVTDEMAPVTVLQPGHPVFRSPNAIGPETWDGWVQERGTYFLGERDPRYVDLVEMADPFPYNAGAKRGALVEAKVGTGRWVYVGLNLWRQLPSGTPGAYRLLANLIGLKRARDT